MNNDEISNLTISEILGTDDKAIHDYFVVLDKLDDTAIKNTTYDQITRC